MQQPAVGLASTANPATASMQQGAGPAVVPGPIAGSPATSTNASLELLVAGMRQLQEATLRATNGSPKGDATETIKPGVASLPTLPEPCQDAPVDFQDWMYSISPALEDISDKSAVWWHELLSVANDAYASFLKLDPVSRLAYVPTPSSTLSLAKWYRVQIPTPSRLLF